LLAHRLRTLAPGQFLGRWRCAAIFFLLDGVQRLVQDFRARRPLPAASGSNWVRHKGEERGGGLLLQADTGWTLRIGDENVAPGPQSQFRRWQIPRPGQMISSTRRFNRRPRNSAGAGFQTSAARFSATLTPFARSPTRPAKCVRFRQNPADQELAGFFKQYKHNEILWPGCRGHGCWDNLR
jgi:hypothetical protein